MKNPRFNLGLLLLLSACVLGAVVHSGCVSKPAKSQDSFMLEGLDRAAGPIYDTPVLQ